MLSLLEFITYRDLSDRVKFLQLDIQRKSAIRNLIASTFRSKKIANIPLKGNSRPTIRGIITFFLAMQICVRVKLEVLIDKIIPSLRACHRKMEFVIVIG